MKIRVFIILTILGVSLVLTGCSSTRIANSSTQTSVALTGGNYKTLESGAIGTSYGFRLLGIFPFANASYTKAQKNLYRNYERESGQNLNGRSIALTDTREDKSAIYLILFSVPKRTVSGNIIEWIPNIGSQQNAPPVSPNLSLAPVSSSRSSQ